LLLALLACAGVLAQVKPPPLVIEEQGVSSVALGMLADLAGVEVRYDPATRTAHLGGSVAMALTAGQTEATIAGKTIALPAAPSLRGGVLYVPVRATAGALGLAVGWDAPRRALTLSVPATDVRMLLPTGDGEMPEVTSPTHEAVEGNDQDALRKLLAEKPTRVRARRLTGDTPLHVAVWRADVGMATRLLDAGAPVDAPAQQGRTPLHLAASMGQVEVIKLLLARGADVNRPDLQGRTPLFLSALSGDADGARLLLNAKADVKVIESQVGYTPLHAAAEFGHMEVGQALVDCGAPLGALDGHGLTPLHLAALNDRDKVVTYLLDSGADINALTPEGATPLLLTLTQRRVFTMKLLLKRGARTDLGSQTLGTPLHVAVGIDDAELVKLLLDSRAPVNARGAQDQTALHVAAAADNAPLVRILLARGANVNARGAHDITPLHAAAERDSLGSMMLLIDAGAEVNRRMDDTRTPLRVALDKGYDQMADFLRDRGGTE
jgi:ankyrin repeat protein